MDAITRQFILPISPQINATAPCIYPWEQTNLFNLCQQLYELAARTGFHGTFDDFKTYFGSYLENDDIVIDYNVYDGQYILTPLPSVDQILRTKNKLLTEDIIIEPIPYAEVSNNAGGKTVTIG